MKKFWMLALAVLFATTASQAFVVITIDPSDLNAITFTATGAVSQVDDASSITWDGVTLLGVLAAAYTEDSYEAQISNLSASGALSESYDFALVIDGYGALTPQDINLYCFGGSQNQIFSTAAAAFTGQAVFSLPGAVFTPGSRGDIIVGDTQSGSGATIGQWQVIPEPSALVMIAPFGLAFALRRARRRGGAR